MSHGRRLLVLVPALALLACGGGDVPTIDCASVEVKGYSELGDSLGYCTDCHGSGRAAAGIDLSTYEGAVSGAEASQAAIADGSMPPEGMMPDDLQQAFYAWAQCGTPE